MSGLRFGGILFLIAAWSYALGMGLRTVNALPTMIQNAQHAQAVLHW